MTLPVAAEAATPSHGRIWATGVLVLVALAVLIWIEPRRNPLQDVWFDTYQVVAPRRIVSMPATVVEIDEASLARLGQWPWPRNVLADLIRRIERNHPAAIGIDILMPEVDRLSPQRISEQVRQQDPGLASRLDALPSTDAVLAEAIAAGPLVLPLAGTPDPTGRVLRAPPVTVFDPSGASRGGPELASGISRYRGVLTSIDEIDRAAVGHGLISVEMAKGVVRQIALVASVEGTLVPSLAIEMLRVGTHTPALRVVASGPALRAVAIGDLVVPTQEDGAVRIYYSRPDPRRYVSAVDVLDGKVDPIQLESKLVLVGTTGVGLGDASSSPRGDPIPGSEIQAQLLENLYDQTWLTRPSWARLLELAVFLSLGLLLIWVTPRWPPRHAVLLAVGCVVVPAAAAYAAFRSQRLLFDAATPGVALLLLFTVLLVLTLAEAVRRRKSLERVIQAQREQAAYIDGELQAARRIQTGILPRAELIGDDVRVDLAASMIPAREVGGDLYDFFPLDGRRLFFLVGDVAGKGLSASIFMAVSKALYKSTTLRSPAAGVSELMRTANDEVSRDNPEMFFVTAFAGVLDLETGELVYCNAGHENPYLLDPGRVSLARLEEGGGPPLCAVEGFAYAEARYRMNAGEVLCVVTDGVRDAHSAAGERYGSGRLQALLARLEPGATAQGLVDAIAADVAAFARGAEPTDDITVLALRWSGPQGEPAPATAAAGAPAQSAL